MIILIGQKNILKLVIKQDSYIQLQVTDET